MASGRPWWVAEYQAARRRRRRHWVAGVGLAIGVPLAVFGLSQTVNAVAYLAGAGSQGVFTATRTHTECSYGTFYSNCATFTDGYLEPGHVPATWTGPAHGSFPVRMPVWDWGPGGDSVYDGGSAVIDAAVFGGLPAGSIVFAACDGVWTWRSARRRGVRGRLASTRQESVS